MNDPQPDPQPEEPQQEPAQTPTQTPQQARPAKSKADRWVKLGFLAVVLVLGFWLWQQGRKGADLGWPIVTGEKAFQEKLDEAKKDTRSVVVYFTSNPRSLDGNENVGYIRKGQNHKAIEKGNYLCVEVKLPDALKTDLAKRYNITKLPTMLRLDSDGKELNRRIGRIGQLDFRRGFLDRSRVIRPDDQSPE